jgi:hypothetical protein
MPQVFSPVPGDYAPIAAAQTQHVMLTDDPAKCYAKAQEALAAYAAAPADAPRPPAVIYIPDAQGIPRQHPASEVPPYNVPPDEPS